jgi:hypothetical protein
MKKLKLDLDDLSVESFASGRALSLRGTVQGRDQEDQLEPIGETGGETYDEFCGGTDYAATRFFSCLWQYSCQPRCTGGSTC